MTTDVNSKLLIGKPRLIKASTISSYMFLAPMFAVVLCLITYPIVDGIFTAFTNRAVARPGEFIGFSNFIELFKNEIFVRAIGTSFLMTACAVGGKLVLAMLAAILLTQEFPFRNFIRALVLIPWAVPGLIGALTWRWIYTEEGGILNYLLQTAGLISEPVFWVSEASSAVVAIIVATVWHGLPFFIMMFMAGMAAIPGDLYEAAAIDGASAWRRFWSVTIPQMHDVIMITVMLSSIWTFNSFHMVFILTGGGPGNKTHIMPSLAYYFAIQRSQLGTGAAVMVSAIPAFIVIIVMLTRRMLKSNDIS
jgi:multiple sugar transport system permease protein